MRVSCPSCQKVYKLPDEKMRPEGVKVKCKECGFVFVVMPEEAAPKEPRFLIQTPEGEKWGPFIKQEVLDRIASGEIRPGFIAYREGELKPYPVEELPEFADAPWPRTQKPEDLGLSSTVPTLGGTGEEDLFGTVSSFEEKAPEEDLFGAGFSPGEAPHVQGEEGEPSRAAPGLEEDLFGAIPGEEPALSSGVAPMKPEGGEGALFEGGLGEGAEQPPSPSGLEEDLFGGLGEEPAAPAPPSSPPPPQGAPEEDLFGGFEESAAPTPPPPSPPSEEDLFGEIPGEAPSPPPPPSRGGAALDQLFEEEPAPKAPEEELSETAFAFSGEEVQEEEYEEERLQKAEARVKEELAQPPPPSPLEEIPLETPSQPAAIPEEELVTTLEELRKVRRAQKSRTLWIVLGVVLLTLLGLGATILFLPAPWTRVPYLGERIENLHARLHTGFFRTRLLPERLRRVRESVASLNPRAVTAATPTLAWLLQYASENQEAHELLLKSFYFSTLIVRRPDPLSGTLARFPEVQWVLWARGEGGVAPPADNTMLLAMLRAYHTFWVEGETEQGLAALSELTLSTPVTGMEGALLAMTRARLAEEEGDFEEALSHWEEAHEFLPRNPWISLEALKVRVRHLPVWVEIEEILGELGKSLNDLSPFDQASYYAIRARKELAQENPQQALSEAQKGLALYPDHPELLTLQGLAHFKLRHLADANISLEKAYNAARDVSETVIAYAQLLHAVGRTPEALNVLKEANQRSREVAYYAAMMEIYLAQNRLKEGEALLEEAFQLFPEEPVLFRLGADIYLAQENLTRAAEYLDRYRSLYPHDLRALVKLVALRLKQGELAQAKQLLNEVFARNPSEPEALRYQAQILIAEGAYHEGERILLKSLEQDPHRLETFLLLAEAYLGLKDPKNAEGMVQQALAVQSLSWKAQELLGRAYLQAGKVTDAVAVLERAVELSNGHPETILWLARALEVQNQPGKALEQYNRLIALDPSNLDAYRKVAELNLLIGQWQDALQALERWEKQNPSDPALYILYGKAWNGKGDYQKTVTLLSRAVTRFPREPELLSELGWAWVKLGEPNRAYPLLYRATQIRGEDPLFWYRLGIAYRDLAQKSKAREALEKALALGLPPGLKESAQSELKTLSY